MIKHAKFLAYREHPDGVNLTRRFLSCEKQTNLKSNDVSKPC